MSDGITPQSCFLFLVLIVHLSITLFLAHPLLEMKDVFSFNVLFTQSQKEEDDVVGKIASSAAEV